MIEDLSAPIPGESLTKSPKSMPFERPPEINDREEAIQMHLTRLSKPKMVEDILDALELDVDVVTLTEGILRSAVATGVHSIDISMAIAPVIHEFIRTTAEDAGIKYDEGLDDPKEKEKRKAVSKAKAVKLVKEFRRESSKEQGASMDMQPEEVAPSDDMQETIPTSTEPQSEGFFKRRGEE